MTRLHGGKIGTRRVDEMSQRGRIIGITAAGVVLAVGAGAAVAVSANGSTSGTAEASTTTDVNESLPNGEARLPTDEPSAGLAGADAAVPTDRALPASPTRKLARTFLVKTKDPVFFITVDDGNTKNAAALRFVKKNRIPATVFLTNAAVAGQWDYFREFASYGGSVENHTMTHKSLLSGSTPLSYEICQPQRIYGAKFDHVPTLLRPPYGNGGYVGTPKKTRKAIDSVASGCGIKHVVMWNGLAEGGKFQFIRGSLKRGDIVLFHFTPNLAGELKTVMKMAKAKGLHPAPLTDYLK